MSCNNNHKAVSIEHLKHALTGPLPGFASHKKMIPEHRNGTIPGISPTPSAVLLCLFQKHDMLHCIFTKRAEHELDTHSGQISFPGGRFEKGDADLSVTAIRECFEEIGIAVSPQELLGKLTNLYIPASNFMVTPFVCVLTHSPTEYIIQPTEVDTVLEIPLVDLLDKKNCKEKVIHHKNQNIRAPYYDWNNYHIWGATAMITAELLDIIGKL